MPGRIPADQSPHKAPTTFIASFDSDCPTCFGTIYEGDTVGYVDDVLCCPDCLDELAEHR